MAVVRRTSVLPISAATAFELATKRELFEYVVAPWMRIRSIRGLAGELREGTDGSARLWWLGTIPSWRHHLRIVRVTAGEIATVEHGGPVRTWNHRLTFEPIDDNSCRYTDEIELDDGLVGAGTRLFARAMFAHRHRRWATLATLVSGTRAA